MPIQSDTFIPKKCKVKGNYVADYITYLCPMMINMICEDHKLQVLNGFKLLMQAA